ncbi:MAG: magnesium transporter CorA family protein [Candidatus Woesearchaeota archaeon]
MITYFDKTDKRDSIGEVEKYSELKNNVTTKGFLCFLIQNPTDEDIKNICKDFELDEKPFKKFRTESRSVRYNFNPLVFTFSDYYKYNNKIKVSHLLFIIKKNMLILITSDNALYHAELFKTIIGKAKDKKKYSAGQVLYEFLHQDARENYDVIEEMDDKIMELEQKVIGNNREKIIIQDIISLKKDLIQLTKNLWASSKVIFTIKKDLTSLKLSREETALLDDIYDTFLHQIDLIETQKETVTEYIEIFTTTVSNRLAATSNELNKVMKTMAALTIIIMVPTLIAGVYGTNFHNLPEISWKYGYLFLWIFMAVGVSITYILFHRKGWI